MYLQRKNSSPLGSRDLFKFNRLNILYRTYRKYSSTCFPHRVFFPSFFHMAHAFFKQLGCHTCELSYKCLWSTGLFYLWQSKLSDSAICRIFELSYNWAVEQLIRSLQSATWCCCVGKGWVGRTAVLTFSRGKLISI